jgi:hypothetical protein
MVRFLAVLPCHCPAPSPGVTSRGFGIAFHFDIGLLELNSSRVKLIMDAEHKYPRLRRDPSDRHSGKKAMTEKRITSSGRKIGKIVGIVGGALSKAKPSPCLGAPGSAKPPR